MRLTCQSIEDIGQTGYEDDLDDDRHGQHSDDQRLCEERRSLECEEQDQGGQKGDDGPRPESPKNGVQNAVPSLLQP